jgi:hypothetical protein
VKRENAFAQEAEKKVDGDKNAIDVASFPMPLLVVVGVQSKDAI